MQGMRAVVLLGLVIAVSTCGARGHGEGEQCRFGCDGCLQGGSSEEPCQDGLYCDANNSQCTRPVGLGRTCNPKCGVTAPCSPFCENGLLCNDQHVCEAPRPEGSECGFNEQCQAGLLCNLGYLPDKLALGECHRPSKVGEPCSYTHYIADGTGSHGCLPSLTCVPPTPTAATIRSNPVDNVCTDGPCGFAGVCAPLFSVPFGEACLGGGACVDAGICNVLPVPYFVACTGADSDHCWPGPWPGLCGPSGSAGPPTTAGWSCAAGSCSPGFVCDWLGKCQPRWHGLLDNLCGAYGTMVPLDDFCEFPLTCVGSPAKCAAP